MPDELTNEIVEDRINQPDCASGFVLDGYPRNRQQAEFLSQRQKIDCVISIELSDDQAISRLADRLACKCGLSYHLSIIRRKFQLSAISAAGSCLSATMISRRRSENGWRYFTPKPSRFLIFTADKKYVFYR